MRAASSVSGSTGNGPVEGSWGGTLGFVGAGLVAAALELRKSAQIEMLMSDPDEEPDP